MFQVWWIKHCATYVAVMCGYTLVSAHFFHFKRVLHTPHITYIKSAMLTGKKAYPLKSYAACEFLVKMEKKEWEWVSNTDLCWKFIWWLMLYYPKHSSKNNNDTDKRAGQTISVYNGRKKVMLVITRWTWYLLKSIGFHAEFYCFCLFTTYSVTTITTHIEIQETFP